MATQTLSEFEKTYEARKLIAQNVLKWTNDLCAALKQNYVDDCVHSYERNLLKAESEFDVEYYTKRIKEIKANPDYDFVIESGRKYYKIVMVNNQRSVHAFVDKKTGEVYKPAGWKSPAKHVRYDLRVIKDREYVMNNCDWAGGYLYMR
tara:strand:- start:389 stop:835 length:447 start_codon:yes stop_codon:yes gene_type:complete